jgi:DNA helicase-2/ATP-dependent DNA helicase PcrA
MRRLNPQQQEVADHVNGPLVVFAGAGSGKTASATARIASLIRNERVAPARILAVTFTRKAANELRERVEHMVGDTGRELTAGTFHSVCVRMLRKYAGRFGRRNDFVVYADKDQEALVKAIVKDEEVSAEEESRDWPKGMTVDRVIEAIEKNKRQLRTWETLRDDDPDEVALKRVWGRYEAQMRGCNAFDFADLIVNAMHLAESHDEAGRDMRGRFDHVLVDEFQDTDEPQFRLVRALASNGNLCVIGDDDQCIYSWRGAIPEYIRNFREYYPNAKVVKLEQNYRSTKRIVGSAASIIEQNGKEREPKRMWSENDTGDHVLVVTCEDEREEARFIAQEASKLIAQGAKPREVTVLYRSHTQSRAIEEELRGFDLRYKIHGGHRYFDRAEIRDAMAYMRLLVNPWSNVDVMRAINTPSRGIGPKTLGRLGDLAAEKECSLFEALEHAETWGVLGDREMTGVREFRDLILSARLAAEEETPAQIIEGVLYHSGLIKHWQTVKAEAAEQGKTAKVEDAQQRIENLQELITDVTRYEQRAQQRGEKVSLDDYVERVSMLAEESDNEDERSLQLMTIHASKGLEFDNVFLVGCELGVFPSGRSQPGSIEAAEERRLMYVAVTRARKRLYMTHASQRFLRGQTMNNPPSPYFKDMPSDATNFAKAKSLLQEEEENLRRTA